MSVGNYEVYSIATCQDCKQSRSCKTTLVCAGLKKTLCGSCYKKTQAPIKKALEAQQRIQAQWAKDAGES